MRLFLTGFFALTAIVLSTSSASAQSLRVYQCCGHTKIVQKGTGFGSVAPVQGFGGVQTFGAVPVQSFGSVQTFGSVPLQSFGGVHTFGAVPLHFGGVGTNFGAVPTNQFGSSPSNPQFGSPLGVLAAQFGVEFVAELISQLKGSVNNSSSSTSGGGSGSGEKPLDIPGKGKSTSTSGGSADLSAIDQKLNAILTLQALNTATSAKILETVVGSDKKLDDALKLLNAIKPKTDKLP